MTHTYTIFSAQYLPHVGGVERYTFHLACNLRERGNKVIIVTANYDGLKEFEVDENGIQIYRISSVMLCEGRMPVTVGGREWNLLQKKLEAKKTERVIIQTRLYPLSLLGYRFAKKYRIPAVVIEHGTGYVRMSGRLLQAAEILYEKLLLSQMQPCQTIAYAAVSKAGTEWLEQIGIRTKYILYNSIDDKNIKRMQAGQGTNLHEVLNINKKIPIMAFVGRLIPEKGIRQLVNAVEKMGEQYPLKLIVVGGGPLEEELSSRKWRHCYIVGEKSHDHVIEILAQSKYFCLPSDSEGFPTSMLEAVFCNCYVVTAPYGGAKELICGRDYGYVMEGNQKEEIEKAIRYVMEHEENVKTAVGRARQLLEKEFTFSNTCDRLEELFWDIR